ncbi:hypothetical protein HZH66_001041 [Vespula vulgaris]|uniref:Uncharacterized protein n=1 Tax=Vespula vulgaris TaxID=7454 RepID=A0A834NKB0_VESVU|nr:hypothetical protein HZH66_001041 [Vespula vulgaris]
MKRTTTMTLTRVSANEISFLLFKPLPLSFFSAIEVERVEPGVKCLYLVERSESEEISARAPAIALSLSARLPGPDAISSAGELSSTRLDRVRCRVSKRHFKRRSSRPCARTSGSLPSSKRSL